MSNESKKVETTQMGNNENRLSNYGGHKNIEKQLNIIKSQHVKSKDSARLVKKPTPRSTQTKNAVSTLLAGSTMMVSNNNNNNNMNHHSPNTSCNMIMTMKQEINTQRKNQNSKKCSSSSQNNTKIYEYIQQ